MDWGLLNLGSILCGMAGWILPCLSLRGKEPPPPGRQGRAAAASLGLCGLALWVQLWYQRHLVAIGDWPALMDTSGAVTKVGALLLASTLLLNLFLLALTGAERGKQAE